jgi:hypothetical protein
LEQLSAGRPGQDWQKVFPTKKDSPNGLLTGQGDQIGRIFAHWATVYYGQVF